MSLSGHAAQNHEQTVGHPRELIGQNSIFRGVLTTVIPGYDCEEESSESRRSESHWIL